MASVHTPVLTLLSHDHARKTATLKVDYVLHQSALEQNLTGLRYREEISLWGADSPDPDDHLYNFSTQIYSKAPGVHLARTRTVTLSDDILDEDGFPRPTDEVYARVCVTPLLPARSCNNSNQISHNF